MVRVRIYLVLSLALVLSSQCFGQDSTNIFFKAFKAYQTERPSQQLHFVFNQNQYAPGDTIFFKSYLLNAASGLWSSAQIVEINLIDNAGEVRQSARMKTDKGIGYNQIVLPESLENGFYNFTAFTNWMRNFGPESMYQHQIEVVSNASIERPSDLMARVEGGNLVAKVPANIIARTSLPGDSLILLDGGNRELARVVSDAYGFASFRITPEQGLTYQIKSSGDQIVLPKVQNEGYNLSITKVNDQFSRLRALGVMTGSGNSSLTLIFSTGGSIYFQQEISAQEPFQTNIDRKSLPPGIHKISLLHPNGELLAFREFYIPISNSVTPRISVQPGQVNSRNEVNLNIQLQAGNQPVTGEFSVSVLNTKAFNDASFSRYIEEFYLEERAQQLPQLKNKGDQEEVIDHVLVLYPKELNWQEMMKPLETLPYYGLSSLYQLRGIARDSVSGEVLPMGSTLMAYLQRDLMRYEVVVGYEGRFELNLLDVFGEDELFVIAEDPKGEEVLNVEIEWTNFPMPAFASGNSFRRTTEPNAYTDFHKTKSKINESYSFFNASANLDSLADAQRMEAPKVPILEVDNSINVDDFYLFPTMSQFVTEVVRQLRVGQQKGKPLVRMKYLEPNIATGDPLYIIDGIATKNTDFFLSLNPKELQTISVIKLPRKLSRFGLMAKNGIVIVNSKLRNIREKLNPKNMILGLNRPSDFPVLDEEWALRSSNPEFRSTVYWNPSINTDENGQASIEFYTSDDEADLLVLIQGISNDQPFQFVHRIPRNQSN